MKDFDGKAGTIDGFIKVVAASSEAPQDWTIVDIQCDARADRARCVATTFVYMEMIRHVMEKREFRIT